MEPLDPRETVAGLCRQLVERGLAGVLASGNVSCLAADGRTLAITRSGVSFADTTAGNVVTCDVAGDLRSAAPRTPGPSIELPLHLATYRTCRFRPRAVLHLHSHYAVAVACLDLDALPFVHYHQALLGSEPTPFVPYRTPGSPELAELAAQAFERVPTRALLLAHHGSLVAVEDPATGVPLAEVLEDVCRLLIQTGGRHRELGTGEFPRLAELFQTYGR